MKQATSARQMMILMTFLASLAGAGTLGSLLAEFGIGRFPARNEGDQQAGRVFSYKLILQLLASSGIINLVYRILVEASGGNKKAQEASADAMELSSLLLMVLAGVKGNVNNAADLLQGIKDPLEKKIEKTESFVSQAMIQEEEKGKEAMDVSIALQQAKLAVSSDQFEGLIHAGEVALETINSTPDQLMEDFEEIKEFAHNVKQACQNPQQESTSLITGIIRSV